MVGVKRLRVSILMGLNGSREYWRRVMIFVIPKTHNVTLGIVANLIFQFNDEGLIANPRHFDIILVSNNSSNV